jgi:hypothetical protein
MNKHTSSDLAIVLSMEPMNSAINASMQDVSAASDATAAAALQVLAAQPPAEPGQPEQRFKGLDKPG